MVQNIEPTKHIGKINKTNLLLHSKPEAFLILAAIFQFLSGIKFGSDFSICVRYLVLLVCVTQPAITLAHNTNTLALKFKQSL